MRKRYEKWTRLRNAVYVTYPYARKAGLIINDINKKMEGMPESQHKAYIQSREKELKKEFTAPLTNLSVYQGRVLMKLINRQTGNNCYNIIKEYKGGFTAGFWQTVAFFFGSSLKQAYDPTDEAGRQAALNAQRLGDVFRARDMAVLYLNAPEAGAAAFREFSVKHKLTGDHLFLTTSQWDTVLPKLRPTELPAAFIIERTGKINTRNAPLPNKLPEVRALIQKLL